MSQPLSHITSIQSTSGFFGLLQLISHSRGVLLDVQSRSCDTTGNVHWQYAIGSLDLDDAHRVRDLLDAAIEAAECTEPRQPGLWGESTSAACAGRRCGFQFPPLPPVPDDPPLPHRPSPLPWDAPPEED